MESKSKRISFLGHQVFLCDREIEKVKDNDGKMCRVFFYDGSGHKEEIAAWPELREPLRNFLINHFESQKEKYYAELQEVLKNQ